MTVSLANITGAAQSGFTTPGYTVTQDVYPGGVNGKQWAISAITGTQAGVRPHSVSDPFTIAFTRPVSAKALQSANPVTGRYGTIPKNSYSVVGRKGVNFAANQAPEVALSRSYWEIPAGSDSYDAPNIRALASSVIGAMSQVSSGFGDTLVTSIL